MGVLQKMTHILHKVDSNNTEWKQRQIERVNKAIASLEEIDDSDFREKSIIELEKQKQDIEEAFENNELDYGRKLYLIENCIYGVDIQSIAIQISKLRFFISLIVDQKIDTTKANYGVRPLPNLETKFVAANTLIGIEKPNAQLNIFDTEEVKKLEKELKAVRHKLFSSKSPKRKRELREEDKSLRTRIAHLLETNGMGNQSSRQLAEWDPYDQNASSPFFNPEWMFGLADGFDVVIGNPPYIKEYTDKSVFNGLRNSECYQGKMDFWYLFGCKSIDILKEKGITSFIATNNWVTNEGASKFRNKVLQETVIKQFLDFRDFMIFESASIQTMVYVLEKNKKDKYILDYRRVATEKSTRESAYELLIKTGKHDFFDLELFPDNLINERISFFNDGNSVILNEINKKSNFVLDKNKEVAQGIVAPQDCLNNAGALKLNNQISAGSGIFNLNNEEKGILNLLPVEESLIKPFYTTNELSRYYGNANNNLWVIYTDSKFKNPDVIKPYPNIKNHLDKFADIITSDNKPYGLHRARNEYFFQGEKIISLRKCVHRPTFTYTDFDCYVSQTYFIIKTNRINQKYLTALLNSKLIAFWLRNKGKMQGNAYQVDKGPILEIPLHKPSEKIQKLISKIVNLIIVTIPKNNEISIFFESVVDALIFNLYFPEHMQERKIDVLPFVERDIDKAMQGRDFENLNDAEKEQVIEHLHQCWTDPDNEVVQRMAQFKEKSPDILKVIMEG